MPVRVRYDATIELSSGTQEQKDLGNVSWSVVTDGLGEGGTWKTLVPAAVTDLEIRLDNIANVNFLALKTTAKDPTQTPVALDFKKETVNGEVFQVKPLPSTKEGHYLITTDGITALFVTNTGSIDMEVIVTASGD